MSLYPEKRTHDDGLTSDRLDPENLVDVPTDHRYHDNLAKMRRQRNIAIGAGGATLAALVASGAFLLSTRSGGESNETPTNPEPSVSAPVVPGVNEQPPVSEDIPSQPEVEPEEVTLTAEEAIRQQRLMATDEEMAENPDLWVYPDLPTGPDSFKSEVYGGTLEYDMKIKTNGIFTDYPEGGALTISGKLADLIEYDLQLPYKYNVYDVNTVDQLPGDLVPYYQRVHEATMDNLFADNERNGDFATYFNEWSEETLGLAYGDVEGDPRSADTDLDFIIPTVDSLQNLQLNDTSNQRFVYEGVEFDKSYGSNAGISKFDITIDAFPIDEDGDGVTDYIEWKIVDSKKVS